MYTADKRTEKSESENEFPDITLHERMKRQLAGIMQVNNTGKSILSRIARIWGMQPWWLKGIELLIISAPTVALAIITQTWIIFAATATIGVLFIGVSLLLDNHHACEKEARKSVSTLIDSMVSFWSSITSRLSVSAMALEENVVRMDGMVEVIAQDVDRLHEVNGMIGEEVENFQERVVDIDKSACELAETTEKLAALQEAHRKLVQESGQKNAELQRAFAANNAGMALRTRELELVIEAQKIQSKQAEAVNATLKETVRKLVEINASSREQGTEFHASMQRILQNAETRFDTLLDDLNQTGARYAREVDRMAENNAVGEAVMARDMMLTETLESFLQGGKEASRVRLSQKPAASCRMSAGMFQPETGCNGVQHTGFVPAMVS